LDAGPARRGQNNDGNVPRLQVLLILELRVSGDEYLEAFLLRRIQQLAVLQPRPVALVRGRYFVMRQRLTQRDRGSLVEKYAHLSGGQCAPCGVLQNRANLLQRHAREPLHKLGHQCTVFKIFKQRCHRHAGATENPCAADPIRVALDR